MHALEINNLVKIYPNGVQALAGISCNIQQGEFVGLLGSNGAGKTSLIAAVAGINAPYTGQIKIMGYDLNKNPVAAKKNVGVVPQEIAFDPFLTVYQTLVLQAGLYGVKNYKSWLDEVIAGVCLTDKISTNTRSLSGGMKRRLMVAQALIHRPPLLILDEPSAGVDIEIRKNIWEFITKLHKNGHTILLTTHYLEEAEKLCNKIIMIDKGKIIAQSSQEELRQQASALPSTLELEIRGNSLASSLSSLIISQDNNKFLLKLEHTSSVLAILTILEHEHIIVDNIVLHQPNLESIFLHYLGR